MDAYERRRLLRTGRLQNARVFFMKNPLGLLTQAVAHNIPLGDAFHVAGPSLKRAYVAPVLTEEQREIMAEVKASMLEAYAADYDRAIERNLSEYGFAFSNE